MNLWQGGETPPEYLCDRHTVMDKGHWLLSDSCFKQSINNHTSFWKQESLYTASINNLFLDYIYLVELIEWKINILYFQKKYMNMQVDEWSINPRNEPSVGMSNNVVSASTKYWLSYSLHSLTWQWQF